MSERGCTYQETRIVYSQTYFHQASDVTDQIVVEITGDGPKIIFSKNVKEPGPDEPDSYEEYIIIEDEDAFSGFIERIRSELHREHK